MNRAMFSGVAGLKTHQTKMDVIGNNIANVNTYGFKSQRAVFSDIFYQTLQGASAGTGSRGGTNPSSVGYGSQLASIQTQMSQSSMQSTGYGLDVAITGEGFFQVMDPDGNIFYTKAGIFDYDANGYLVDVNGNFVLGTDSTDGSADSKRLKISDIGTVTPASSMCEATINGIDFTLSTSNNTSKGNMAFNLLADSSLPLGQQAKAIIDATGTITVTLNSNEYFASLTEVNTAINKAITEANGGKTHNAGNFTLVAPSAADMFTAAGTGGLSGAEICGTSFDVKEGELYGIDAATGANNKRYAASDLSFFGTSNIKFLGTSKDFAIDTDLNAAHAVTDFSLSHEDAVAASGTTAGTPERVQIELTVNSNTYTGYVTVGNTAAGSVLLEHTAGSGSGNITITHPGYEILNATATASPAVDPLDDSNAIGELSEVFLTSAKPSNDLGLSSMSFNLEGGTEGGPASLDELSSISIGADGIISVTHPELGTVAAGRISLANFANPAGLELNGTNYYSASPNSGEPKLCDPGADGSGSLKSNALEMSNVDLSAEFADMITTQRGFQANSRIITVSDTMLEELINLKR